MRLCGDCLKGALQIPVSIQFNSIQWKVPKSEEAIANIKPQPPTIFK
jgi:hypothetical protein